MNPENLGVGNWIFLPLFAFFVLIFLWRTGRITGQKFGEAVVYSALFPLVVYFLDQFYAPGLWDEWLIENSKSIWLSRLAYCILMLSFSLKLEFSSGLAGVIAFVFLFIPAYQIRKGSNPEAFPWMEVILLIIVILVAGKWLFKEKDDRENEWLGPTIGIVIFIIIIAGLYGLFKACQSCNEPRTASQSRESYKSLQPLPVNMVESKPETTEPAINLGLISPGYENRIVKTLGLHQSIEIIAASCKNWRFQRINSRDDYWTWDKNQGKILRGREFTANSVIFSVENYSSTFEFWHKCGMVYKPMPETKEVEPVDFNALPAGKENKIVRNLGPWERVTLNTGSYSYKWQYRLFRSGCLIWAYDEDKGVVTLKPEFLFYSAKSVIVFGTYETGVRFEFWHD